MKGDGRIFRPDDVLVGTPERSPAVEGTLFWGCVVDGCSWRLERPRLPPNQEIEDALRAHLEWHTVVDFARTIGRLENSLEDRLSVEGMCRVLLARAVDDGIVALAPENWDRPDPEERSAGELVGVANLLAEFLNWGVHREG